MNIKPWLLVLAGLGLASSGTAASRIRLASFEYPPFCDSSRPDGGGLVAIVREAFALQSIHVDLVQLPWRRVMTHARQGRVDGVIGIWPDDAKQMQLLAAAPVYVSQLGVYQLAAAPLPASLAQLRGKRAGVVQGYQYGAQVLASGMLFDQANDDETNLRKLQTGRVQVALVEKAVGDYLLQTPRLRLGAPLRWGGLVLDRQPLSVGFAATPRQQAWARQFAAGFARLKQQGRYQQIALDAGLQAYLPR